MKTVESYGTFSTYFCPLYVVSVTFEFLCQLIWQLNENSPYAKHFYRVANKFCYGHSSVRSLLYRNKTYWLPCNYRMTIVKKLLTPLFWSPSSVLHTICATSRSQSASPEINVESVQCVITNVTTQKKSWKSYLPFGIPQIGVTIPQILSKLFVKGLKTWTQPKVLKVY